MKYAEVLNGNSEHRGMYSEIQENIYSQIYYIRRPLVPLPVTRASVNGKRHEFLGGKRVSGTKLGGPP